MFSLPDARGRESKTLAFVFVSWIVLVFKFVFAGLTFGNLGTVPPMSGGEFGGAVLAILMIWLGREWTEKSKQQGDNRGE